MTRFQVFTLDPQFPDSWMLIATVVADTVDRAIDVAHHMPGLRFAPLRAVAV